MFLYLFIVTALLAQVGIDYQLYTNSVGNEYNRVHFPLADSQTVWKLNTNCSFGPLMTVGDEWDDFDIQFLPRADVSIEKYFGSKDVHPFVALQTSAEMNIGQMPQEPLLQAANVVAGLSVSPADLFRASAAVTKGTGFHTIEDTTGVIASAGVSKERFGLAASYMLQNVKDLSSPYKVSAGLYYGQERTRLIFEYDKQFDDEYNPAELSLGVRFTRDWNNRDVFLTSSFATNTSSSPGAGPRISIGITFNLEKKKSAFVEEPVEEKEEEQPAEEEEGGSDPVGVGSDVSPPTEPVEEEKPLEEAVAPAPVVEHSPTTDVDEEPKPEKTVSEVDILERPKRTISKRINTTIASQLEEKQEMPNDTTPTLTAQEVQPTAPTPESLANIAQQSGGDSSLAMLLAILAVIGGGAAWKFYSQFSEQKHEQKMKEMELQAKANGMGAASPPPCQTAQAEMKAEIKSLKTKVAGTAALVEDIDLDLYDRKIKKLDKRLKALEDPETDL